jgi:hypothetical protein
MFKDKAELKDPEAGTIVATLTEDGDRLRVVLKQPVTLSGTTRLAVYGTTEDAELIAVAAANGEDTEIREFHGVSPIGVLPDHAQLADEKPGWPVGDASDRSRAGRASSGHALGPNGAIRAARRPRGGGRPASVAQTRKIAIRINTIAITITLPSSSLPKSPQSERRSATKASGTGCASATAASGAARVWSDMFTPTVVAEPAFRA